MPVAICDKCNKPIPDSFNYFKEVCSCRSKQEWIEYYKNNKWKLRLDDVEYNFTEDK